MRKAKALNSFYYWSDNVITPSGRTNKKAVLMRTLWAKAIDSEIYKKLPADIIKADEILIKMYKRGEI